jgi:hypothetical protein
MGLEIQTGKVPGTEVRRTAAPRPKIVGLMILGLTGITWAMLILTIWAVHDGANDAAKHDPAIPDWHVPYTPIVLFKNEQTIISFWISIAFFSMSFAGFLYQRYFRDHVTIAKKRFRKWEDEGVQFQ